MIEKRVFNDDYEDIVGLEHPSSVTRNKMSMRDRAAQFSPFAALTGHEEVVRETERQVEENVKIMDGIKIFIDEI